MSKVLCVRDIQGFNQLADGEIETLDFQFVDRDVCEKADSGFIQVIPYVSFNHLNGQTGTLDVICHGVPVSGDGQTRPKGRTSFGFGDHIDDSVVVDAANTTALPAEHGDTTLFHLTTANIHSTMLKAARPMLVKHLGFDPIEELEIPTSAIRIALEREREPDAIGLMHLCVSLTIGLDESRIRGFLALSSKAKADNAELPGVSVITIDAGKLIGSLDVVTATQSLQQQLIDELDIKPWSWLVIQSTLAALVGFVQEEWDFPSILRMMLDQRKARLLAQTDTPDGAQQDEANVDAMPDADSSEAPVVEEPAAQEALPEAAVDLAAESVDKISQDPIPATQQDT